MGRSSTRGFTLIELMVAIAVLAILITIAAPSFSALIERSRLRGAADDTVALIQQARSEAVRLGVPINVSAVAATWCVGAIDAFAARTAAGDAWALGERLPQAADADNCACGTADACTVNDVQLRILGADYGPITFTIEEDGEFVIDARTGTLSDSALEPSYLLESARGNYQLRVEVTALGNARACVPAGETPIPGYGSC